MKVLNFGSLNLDHVYRVPHLVLPGETIHASEVYTNPGGKGLNQSVALARAGVKVDHAGCFGPEGEPLVELLKENEVNTEHMISVDVPQGNALIQVDDDGQNSIILYSGSNRAITGEMVTQVLENYKEGDILVLQNEISCMPEIVDQAYEIGMNIFLNPSPYDHHLDDVDFGKCSWLLVNEVEALQMTGETDTDRIWEKFHSMYPKTSLLLTLGGDGSVAFENKNGSTVKTIQEAYKADAVDTTGAGDTYTGYFIAGIIAGYPMQLVMSNASRAASIAVTRPGAAASIPHRFEVYTR